MKSSVFLSVVVPVYNESDRIQNVRTICSYFAKKSYSTEVIVVNDGSTDATVGLLGSYTKKLKNLKVLSLGQNFGKGKAVKTGMLAACGKYSVFIDVDLSTPISSIDAMLPMLAYTDVVIASRKTRGSILNKRQPFIRETLGRLFTWLSSVMLHIPVSDFTCGCKGYTKKAKDVIFSRLTIDRWGFDTEALLIAHRRGLFIREVPVRWQNDDRSKVKFPDDVVRSLIDLTVICLHDFFGTYNRE